MSAHVLVAYASKHGSTREVAQSIAETFQEQGLDVDVREAELVDDVASYDAVLLGGALYTGRLHADARRFLRRHRTELAQRPLAIFAMGPSTLAEADVAGSRRQLDRALAQVAELEPVAEAIFGGVIDPTSLRFPFNRMPASDARDWDAIHAWAEEVAESLGARAGSKYCSGVGEPTTPVG
jgi:menaquinone-dependent protoporphyrinogen oxidase